MHKNGPQSSSKSKYSTQSSSTVAKQNALNTWKKPQHSSFVTAEGTQSSLSCKCCQGAHHLSSCAKFRGWPVDVRFKWARDKRICYQCLHSGHWVQKCRSKALYNKCSRNHHELLHQDVQSHRSEDNSSPAGGECVPSTSSLMSRSGSSASQICAITSSCSKRLGLRQFKWTAPVSGLAGASVQGVQGIVQFDIQPRFSSDPVLPVKAWVFPSITEDMPRSPLPNAIAVKYSNLALAYPSFGSPAPIDLLLGADLFAQILDGKRISVGNSCPVAFGSIFGWIIIGPVPAPVQQLFQSCPISLTTSIETMMDRFWKVEDTDAAPEDFTDEG